MTGLAGLALELREAELLALLEPDATTRERMRVDVTTARGRLEAAAAAALARGHPVGGVSAATFPSWSRRARFEAMGRLAAACAPVAEVEEVLLDEGRALGGEVPAGRSTQLRAALALARGELDVAVRGAVLRGVAPAEILGIARAAGLDVEEGDLALAFETRRVPEGPTS